MILKCVQAKFLGKMLMIHINILSEHLVFLTGLL